MKRFSEIKESKNIKKATLETRLDDILQELNVEVSGEDAENLSNVDINIKGQESVVEKLQNLITDIRITERKTTLNIVKKNSYQNFDMKWLNEQIDGLEKIKLGNSFVLNEQINDTQLRDNFKVALTQYFIHNLNGEKINGWEFNYDENAGVFDFINKSLDLCVKATPFWNGFPEKIPFEIHHCETPDGAALDKEVANFNIEEILYKKYLELFENFTQRENNWNNTDNPTDDNL
jgi:hypothetical protein